MSAVSLDLRFECGAIFDQATIDLEAKRITMVVRPSIGGVVATRLRLDPTVVTTERKNFTVETPPNTPQQTAGLWTVQLAQTGTTEVAIAWE